MTSVYGAEVSPSNESVREARAPRAMIFFIYLIFGPPVGGIAFVAGFMGYDFITQFVASEWIVKEQDITGVAQIVALSPLYILVVIFFSYFFGGLQAAATGLIITLLSKRNGTFGYVLAFIAPLVPSMLGAWMFRSAPGFASLLATTGVFASLAIRFLFRKRFASRNLNHD